MTTMGKFRHLSRCSTSDGRFVVLAIDHRANLLDKLNQHAPQPLDDAAFSAFKQAIINALLPEGSAVLTDPAYGIGVGVADHKIGGSAGLLAPIEVTDYDLHPGKRPINFIPNWSVAKIKRMGGDGVKLLLPYHPEAHNSAEKDAIVQKVVAECNQHDIPFFLEPIACSLDPEKPLSNPELRQVVVDMAKTFSAMGVDILKMEFPVDAKQSDDEAEWISACVELDAACTVPWALLSAGVNYETFARQARIACQAGASGVIVGRAVWSEAVAYQGEARMEFINTIARQRMREMAQICVEYATPWFQRVSAPDSSFDWYESYIE
jgi:tagatose-1,6-bisphosphate aldolase